MKGVSILGPTRSATQIEISLTDARTLGIKAPVKESGDIAGSGACKLVGPCGEVELTEGVIAAKRHIHMTPEDAAAMGGTDKEIVKVKIDSNGLNIQPLLNRLPKHKGTVFCYDTSKEILLLGRNYDSPDEYVWEEFPQELLHTSSLSSYSVSTLNILTLFVLFFTGIICIHSFYTETTMNLPALALLITLIPIMRYVRKLPLIEISLDRFFLHTALNRRIYAKKIILTGEVTRNRQKIKQSLGSLYRSEERRVGTEC